MSVNDVHDNRAISRRQPDRKQIEYLDFAKGFAILSIVLFHYCQPYATGLWSKAIMLGGSGVHLFFLLSGFGLALSSKSVSYGGFLKKRFSRVLLPYYLVVTLIFLINLAYPLYSHDGLYAWLGHIFLFKMFDERIVGSYGYHFWFISTIIQFYLIFPLLLAIRRRLSLAAFAGSALLVSFLYWFVSVAYNVVDLRVFNSFFLQYLWEFVLGMVLAELYQKQSFRFWQQPVIPAFMVAVAGIATMAFLSLKHAEVGKVLNDIPASLGYIELSIAGFLITRYLPPLRRLLVFIGRISYEFYLLHMLVFFLITRTLQPAFTGNSGLALSLLLVMPLAIMASSAMQRFERQIL